MESLDYWRFCSELTVVQAALLIIGLDPTPHLASINQLPLEKRPLGYVPVFAALQNDINSHWLTAEVQKVPMEYGDTVEYTDWNSTRVSVKDLKEWLSERGVTSGFFFPEGPAAAEYLDRSDPSFSAKLAAAVEAWKAVKAERAIKTSGRSVKTDLTKWLNIHAFEYGLTNGTGEPNKQAIEEVAKVANWDQKGGAPKTPGN
jgi:hypothetical protein